MAGQIVSEKATVRSNQTQSSLDPLFAPKAVAVIGATENANAVGRTVLANLIKTPFGGTVYPVNPKRTSVLGIKAYPSVKDIPEKVDLAIIVTPANSVPALIQQCADVGVPAAIVISAGFKELGPPGVALEKQVMDIATRAGMRILGPNCLGFMNPMVGLNATFAANIANKGSVAFISQSGALCTAILDWSMKEKVGFSAFVSLGSMLDIGWGDLIDYLGEDPHTKAILIYMETIGDARKFLSAAREVALTKPIIVIKAGRTEAAAKAAASHTGSLAGSDDVLDAAFKRAGVLRVSTIADLFYMAEVLARQPRPKGKRLTIVTNAGGPGVLATDALITGGGELTPISPETMGELNKLLPAAWSHNNPVDVLGDADASRYAKALELVARDENSDGLMVILTPQDMTDPTATAETIRSVAKDLGKPVLASWMGGPFVAAGEEILNTAGIPTFPYPDTAAKMFNYMWQYDYAIKGLYETPAAQSDANVDAAAGDKIIQEARAKRQSLLTESDSKQLLAAYGIPVALTLVANSEDEAAAAAKKVGYPTVLKLYSQTITHKTDVGGVVLDLQNEAQVREAFARIKKNVSEKVGVEHFGGVTVQPMVKMKDAYEVIIGSSCDAQFGPVILFGSGGQLVEVYKDRALALPPLNTTLAKRLIERTKIHEAFKGVRGRKAVNVTAIEQLLVKFSQLLLAQPWIKEVDMNPVLVGPDGAMALDARVILHDPALGAEKLPKPAIRPYPTEYVQAWNLNDNTPVTIRPIRAEDEPLIVKFHENLSEESVRNRYFLAMKLGTRTAHERLVKVCFADYDREMALVAENVDAAGKRSVLAVGRLSRVRGRSEAEFALLVADKWQNKGLGRKLLSLLIDIGRKEGITRIMGYVLQDNAEMQRLCESAGFCSSQKEGDGVVKMVLDL
ncbi:MAG TPA: GNAT family N-acetyltransferase [Phycisphaerae bacterium]|jgi:acetyltransferase|nr:GNAT family N-acetyltransferase [Phycisphaerae bacterium]